MWRRRVGLEAVVVWLLASLALVVAVVACNGLGVGDVCVASGKQVAWSDPCPTGSPCVGEDPTSDDIVCTTTTACSADSDCPSNFGCSATDAYDGASYCATACAIGCAAGYGCAADGVSCVSLLGESCYVTDTSGAGCGSGAACSATTRVCTLTPPCKDDSECGGYACEPNVCCAGNVCGPSCGSLCALSCTPADTTGVLPTTGIGCAPGFACNPQTFTCSSTLGGPCNPGSDDGAQCGLGGACSPGSQTCVAATPCTTDADCSGYGCQNGYCLMTCTANILPCAIGKTCNLNTHTCS